MEIDMTINGQTHIYIATNANTTTDFVKSLMKNIYVEDEWLHMQQWNTCMNTLRFWMTKYILF